MVARVATLPAPELLSPEETRAVTEAALKQDPAEPSDPTEKPKVDRHHSFTVDRFSRIYDKQLTGSFTNQILTPRLELEVSCIKSRLVAAGISSHLDYNSGLLSERMAHLKVSLTAAPDWFDAFDFEDKEVLEEIYMEAASHEARFWGREDRLESNPKTD